MAPWTPADLLIQPKLILDPSTAAWSGSNWGSTANSGSWGGNIVASAGTPTKGTQLNALDVVHFSGSNSLSTSAAVAWPASTDIFVFSVFNASSVSSGLVAQGWGTPTLGWVVYPRINGSGTAAGVGNWATGDLLSFGQGYGNGASTPGTQIDSQPFISGGHKMMTWNSCSAQLLDVSGAPQTLTSSVGTVPAQTNPVYIGESHVNGAFGETFIGDVAYLLIIAGKPTQADYQKLEGWAAWKYNLVSQLPANHPYKSAAPTTGGGTGTLTATVTAATATQTGPNVLLDIQITLSQG